MLRFERFDVKKPTSFGAYEWIFKIDYDCHINLLEPFTLSLELKILYQKQEV